MTATVTTASAGPFAPDGVTTAFPFTFKAASAAEVAVVRLPSSGLESAMSGYSVALNDGDGGVVNFSVAPAAGDPIYIYSDPSFEQQINFANQGNFSPTSVNTGFDRSAVRDIYIKSRLNRALLAPLGETVAGLPTAASRANTFLAFDGSGNPIASTAAGAKGDPGSPGEGYSTRTAMAARLLPAVLDDVYLTEKGREGKFVVALASSWTAAITADTAQGVFIASTADATKVYVRTDALSRPWNAGWFGVKFDDEGGAGTDNLAAINAMLGLAAALGVGKHSLEKPSITIEFPGFFFVSDVVNLYTQVHLKGFGIGQSGGQFTLWRVPSGKAALIGNHFLTRGYTATSDGTQTLAAAGSIIEGIKFLGGTANTVGGGAAYDDTAHADGLLMRTQMLVKDCWFEGFQRNGIAILAGSDGNPILGNANNFVIERCTVQYNGSHGLHIQGTDANAGLVTKLDASFNRRWGVLEESFLGTQLIACHAAANGIGNGTTDVDSVTAFPAGGQRYAVAFGQETAAATTQPGTNGAVWVPIDGSTGGRTWASGFVVRSGGPYALRSASISLFGYSEGGQGPDQCISPSISIGGIKGSAGTAFFGDGIRIGATFGSLTLSGGITPSGSIQIPDDVSANHKFGRFSSGLPFSYFDSSTLSSGFKFRVANGTTDAATITSTGLDLLSGVYRVAGTQVVGARQTGWAADTGTAKKTANATYSGTAEASYTQATIQALMNAVRDLSQTQKALKDALIAHGLIGA
jgi:hypothetical protein